MTQNLKIRKSHQIVYLLVLTLTVLALFFLSGGEGERRYKRFENLVFKKADLLEKQNHHLLLSVQKVHNPDFLLFDSLYHALDEKDFILNVYRNSELIYWSDNILINKLTQGHRSPEILQTPNAVCLASILNTDSIQIILAIPLEDQYKLNNPFFNNKLKAPFNKIAERASFSSSPGHYNVNYKDDTFWFSFELLDIRENGLLLLVLILCLTVLGFLLIALFYRYFRTKYGIVLSLVFLLFVTTAWYYFIEFLLVHLSSANSVYYSPEVFASSILGSSLSQFFITSIFCTFLLTFFRKSTFNRLYGKTRITKAVFAITALLMSFAMIHVLGNITQDVVVNTRLNLDLTNFGNWNAALYIFITSLLVYYISILWMVIQIITGTFSVKTRNYLLVLIVCFFYILLALYLYGFEAGSVKGFVVVFVVLVLFLLKRFEFRLQNIVSTLVLCSILFAFNFVSAIQYKEEEKLKVAAKTLFLQEFEPQLIYMFNNLRDSICNSQKRNFINSDQVALHDSTIRNHIYGKYFTSGYWDKFDIQLVVCDTLDILSIKPDFVNANCLKYFEQIISNYGRSTPAEGLFYVDYGQNFNSFIGVVEVSDKTSLSLVFEFIPRFITREGSYPELLAEKSLLQVLDISSLSMARYKTGRLISYFGDNSFPTFSEEFVSTSRSDTVINFNGQKRFIFRISDAEFMIICTSNANFFRILNVFSYSFVFIIFHVLLILFLLFLLKFRYKYFSNKRDYFQTRVQRVIFIILAISFLMLGVLFSLIIIRYNFNKNKEAISEKSHSILSEFQYKFRNQRNTLFFNSENLNSTLIKLSDIFSTDINVFAADGSLLGSSKPQIFEKGLLASRIHSDAYKAIKYESSSYFVHTERIGNQEFLSAYYPFLDFSNQVIAIINVPFFDTGKQLNQSLSGFYASFIVIYVVLLILSFYLVLFLARQISKPLKTISYHLSRIKLDKKNEVIPMERDDEIGQLIAQYNSMVEELERSRDLMSRAEREKAWRDIARQLAHEIKNPLTPIKLSVQHLLKAWEEKDPEWDSRLRRFSKNLQDQIHVLDTIVSEFSLHAKLSYAYKEKVDVIEIAKVAMMVLSDFNGDLQLKTNQGKAYYILADRVQLTRAINNVLKNSIQATSNSEDGTILLEIWEDSGNVNLCITDNGCGIAPEIAQNIFSPYFTTKATGTGLGLVMTRDIVHEMNGKIWFESTVNQGTRFYLQFPEYRPK